VKVRYRPRAQADLDDIFQYLNERSPTGARHVLGAIADAIDEIAANPDAWQATSVPDIRAKTIGRYRYKIFYAVVGDECVEIIHVRHTARRPWA
jgi:plasmid stabilization system protein ParE